MQQVGGFDCNRLVYTRDDAVHFVIKGVRWENGKYPTLSLFFKQAWQAAMSEERTLNF
ncbi:TPA: hypothetical protein PJH94_000498 [Raoultella planticola]|nr:hypothetical protein [Raoultella planticola]